MQLIKIIENVIADVLTAIYQPFWPSVVFSVLGMFAFLMITDNTVQGGMGWKKAFHFWINKFKTSKDFRLVFCFLFYCSMILFRTLLNRNMWMNPVSHVMGGWWIYTISPSTGERVLTTECIENFLLFIPFANILAEIIGRLKGSMTKSKMICDVTRYVLIVSISIECLQLFLRVGTFQFSDMFYNTFGGNIGVIIYVLSRKGEVAKTYEKSSFI